MGIIKEFKTFAFKGNMIDMAVGIIIGGAFSTVVKSLVDDVIMPVVAGIFELPDFTNLFIVLKGEDTYTSVETAREAGASVLAYGQFINNFIAFVLLAAAVFVLIKAINSLQQKTPPEKKPAGPTELDVLKEIRDSLQK